MHQNGIQKTQVSKPLHEEKQVQFLLQRNIQYLGHYPQCHRYQTTTCQNTSAIQHMQPPMTPKQVRAFLGLVGYYRKFIKGFAKIKKPLTLLTREQAKFDWTPEHHTAFLHLKEAIVQSPILHYPNPEKRYIVYIDASDDNACRAQLSQEQNGTEFPIVFLSHTFTEIQLEMEYYWTRSLWHILYHYQMKLLPIKALTSLLEMTTNL